MTDKRFILMGDAWVDVEMIVAVLPMGTTRAKVILVNGEVIVHVDGNALRDYGTALACVMEIIRNNGTDPNSGVTA